MRRLKALARDPLEHRTFLPTQDDGVEPLLAPVERVFPRLGEEDEERTAYERRKPWRRQEYQDVGDRLDDKRKYVRTKKRTELRQKSWYRKVKRDPQFKDRREDYRENPERFQRRKAVRDVMERMGYTPWSLGKKRHRHHGPERQHRRVQYRRNKAQAKRQHYLWYQKNRNKPGFKRRQVMRRNNPNRFKLRPATEGHGENDLAFLVGPSMALAHVVGMDRERHVVIFELSGVGLEVEMCATAFLNVVVFLEPEDGETFFDMAEAALGEDAFDDLEPEDVIECADLYDVDPYGPAFADLCVRAVGTADLESVEPARLVLVVRLMVSEALEAWHEDDTRTAATIADITRGTSSEVQKRARGVRVRLSRADPDRGIWTFQASGSKGSYTVRVQAKSVGNTKDVSKLQVRVSCDCEFFRYQGPEHWARTHGYLYGKPAGTAAAPTKKDPTGDHWACKHVVQALSLAKGYRVAQLLPGSSTGGRRLGFWPEGAEVVPNHGPSASRVAARYGMRSEG